jgi:hypothetical protein
MSVRDWKIGIRLGAGFGVVLALLVAVWAAAQWSERAVATQTERAMFATKVALSAEKWSAITRNQVNRTEAAIRFGDNPEILNYFQQQIQATRAQVDEIEKTLLAQVKELDDAEVSQQLERVATLRQAQIAGARRSARCRQSRRHGAGESAPREPLQASRADLHRRATAPDRYAGGVGRSAPRAGRCDRPTSAVGHAGGGLGGAGRGRGGGGLAHARYHPSARRGH